MSHQVAILTISDSAYHDHTLDESGPSIAARFRSLDGWTVSRSCIVPDDRKAITDVVVGWSQLSDVNLVITSGGTGFGTRDFTPESISPLLDREAPGFVHMLLTSNPRAVLSRPVAGIRNNTLIITLPGSLKAVNECLDVLLQDDILTHALQLLRGKESRALHEHKTSNSRRTPESRSDTLAVGHPHVHCGHTTPHTRTRETLPSVCQRPRSSPYPMIALELAQELVLNKLSALPATTALVNSTLRGHVLADPIVASQDMPRDLSSNVDGYAVKTPCSSGIYRVLHSLTHPRSSPLPERTVYRINTGAPLPKGANAVIMVEDTRLVSSHSSRTGKEDTVDELEVETLVVVDRDENVRQKGSDMQAGELVLDKGHIIGHTGGDIGTLAFIGRQSVSVIRKPVVAIISTGNELKDIHASVEEGGDSWNIWDANRPILMGVLETLGYTTVDLGIVADGMDAHEQKIRQGLDVADIVISTGGSSMGTTDFLKPVLEQRLQSEIVFGRVKVKPGKPTIFALIPCTAGSFKPFFGLPGNPASALVTFYLFVLPALRVLGGYPKHRCHIPRVKVQLADTMRLDPRPEFHRAFVELDADGHLIARSTGGQRSSRAPSLSSANALVALPAKRDGSLEDIKGGETVEALLIDHL